MVYKGLNHKFLLFPLYKQASNIPLRVDRELTSMNSLNFVAALGVSYFKGWLPKIYLIVQQYVGVDTCIHSGDKWVDSSNNKIDYL